MPLTSPRVQSITANPVQSRADLTELLRDLIAPLIDAQSDGCARIRLGHDVVGYDSTAAELEGFSRALWGIAPLFAGGAPSDWSSVRDRWVMGLENGVDSEHEEYWGECGDFDQRLVEQGGIALAILIAPQSFWHLLPTLTKSRLSAWLLQGNTLTHPRTNWRFFRVLVNLALKTVGADYSQSAIDDELNVVESFIGPDDMPSDGPHGESPSFDYYATSFAIPFYGMIFSKHYPDHPQAGKWKRRAAAMAPRVAHLLAPNGAAIPFGRSMSYRFACVAFWSAAAYAEIQLPAPFTLGVVKGLILRHIRWFTQRNALFNRDGSLSVGWAYPTGYISEEYTSPQGPYWALKSFLILALPAKHAFWTTPEEPYPPSLLLQPPYVAESWKQVFTHAAGHTYLLTSGQMSFKPQRNDAAKYSKFAYSASLGFSLPTDPTTIRGMGADSTLLSSRDGKVWQARRECSAEVLQSGIIRSVWRPFDGAEITTWLVPPLDDSPFHFRIHKINSTEELYTFDSGFAIDNTSTSHPPRPMTRATEQPSSKSTHGRWELDRYALVKSVGGVSGIVNPINTSADIRPIVQDMDAGSNLISPRTVVPALQGRCEPGISWNASCVFAIPSDSPRCAEWWTDFNKVQEQAFDTVADFARTVGLVLDEGQ